MKQNRLFCLLLIATALLLSACGSTTVEEMYSLPKRSPYKNLQSLIETAMNGLEYAAPVSGDNRQSVQMADLDGDGVEEYVIFAKGASENPLEIFILRQIGEEKYEILESISCKGTNFEQVQYAEIDDRPGVELVVGRQISNQVTRIASVYSFASGSAEQIMSSIYSRYITCDLNSDGRTELMVIRNGNSNTGNGVAILYDYSNGVLRRSLEAPLSEKADNVKRVSINSLSGGEPAVFIASSHDENSVITDIVAMNNDTFDNITLSNDSGTSVQTLRNYYVYAEDIDSDGLLELPELVPMRYDSLATDIMEQYLIRWYNLDINGNQTDKMFTFHNFSANWYIELNTSWLDRIVAEEKENACTFYMWNENYREAMSVFSIYTFNGRDRDVQASAMNRFPLYKGENVVYAGKLEAASAIYGVSESYVINSFHPIRLDWKAGET